jgi:ADP-ribose pyrophosphatase
MKIPPQAKKVFKGLIFEVYQWEQEVFDGSTQTYEMLSRADTVDVIAVKGDKILLAHQSQPTQPDFYSLFGGRLEENENLLVGAKRELLEESGLQSEDWELFREYDLIHKIDWTIHTYIARNCEYVSDQKLDPGEKIKIVECTFEEFIEIILSKKYAGSGILLDILYIKDDKEKLDVFKNRLFKK